MITTIRLEKMTRKHRNEQIYNTYQKWHKTTVVPVGSAYSNLPEAKICTCFGLYPSKYAILAATAVRWEGYILTGCWYWASSYSSIASRAIIGLLHLSPVVQMHHLYRSRFLIIFQSLGLLHFTQKWKGSKWNQLVHMFRKRWKVTLIFSIGTC